MNQIEQMETRLKESFQPETMHIEDESHLHVGHEGAKQGGGHYQLLIVSTAFAGKSLLIRHRMIYQVLDDMIQEKKIHALSIKAYTPEEV